MDFRDDPYTIGDGSLRGEYKLVSLISINAKAQGAHIAVKDALEESGFEIANDLKQVTTLMKNYQQAHKPIEKYLFSGVGLDLQNKDSQIMEKILMKLHDYGICGLPIHDSVLVEKKYTDLLYEIMMNAYEEVMGFEPVLK
jgi:DNA-binding ferritin-like protein (Dps family)